MSTKKWMDKLIGVCLDNGIAQSILKEWTTDTRNHTDEWHRHFVEWNKPEPKEYTLYDSIYTKLKNRQN